MLRTLPRLQMNAIIRPASERNDQRFLVNLMPDAAHDEPVTLVRNWDKE